MTIRNVFETQGGSVRRVMCVVLACALASAASACGSDPELQVVKVKATVLDNEFTAGKPLRVAVGDAVEWVNKGRNHHNIIPNTASGFGVGDAEFGPGATYRHQFTTEGSFRYYCSLHGNSTGGMTGVVLVGNVPPPPDFAAAPKPNPQVSGRTINVPADQPTVQGAVDASGPGDLILIAAGTYHEGVEVPVSKSNITIRGVDRNKTILEGDFKKENGIKVVKAAGVAVENMTLQGYTKNGVFWTGVTGYRASYLNTYRNGDYGIYGFESKGGQIEHSYASGSPDAGVYIGGCYPCDSLINDVISEWNGLGYSGTNAGGNLVIANSIFRYNRSGIVPNSGGYEPNAPQRENTIIGNLSHDNGNDETPAIDISVIANGFGIIVAGGETNVVTKNRVMDNPYGGIVVFTYPETAEDIWFIKDNKVTDNIVSGTTIGGDLALFVNAKGQARDGNCFAGNTFETSRPNNIEEVAPCTGTGVGDLLDNPFDLIRLADADGRAPSADYRTAKTPVIPAQPQMPNATTAPARPAMAQPDELDLDTIEVPAAPTGK